MTKLGSYIKSYRETHNLSLRDLARLSGLSHTYIEKLEKGIDPRSGKHLSPTIETLQSLSKATGKSLLEILQIAGYIHDASTFYQNTLDPDLELLWEEMNNREDVQMLLKQIKGLSPKAIHRINKYIEIVENEELCRK